MNISGSFGHAVGGGLPIDLTMPQTGAQGSPLNQVSPTSPNFDPNMVPLAPGQVSGGPPPMMPPQPPQAAPSAQMQPAAQQQASTLMSQIINPIVSNPEESLIIKALVKQLERIGKAKDVHMKGVTNPMPSPGVGGGAGIGY